MLPLSRLRRSQLKSIVSGLFSPLVVQGAQELFSSCRLSWVRVQVSLFPQLRNCGHGPDDGAMSETGATFALEAPSVFLIGSQHV